MSSIIQSLRHVHASFPRMTVRLDLEDFFSVIDPNLIKCASNTFKLSRTKVSTVYLTAAKIKLQRTCFPVMCPRFDENDGSVFVHGVFCAYFVQV